MLQHYTNTVTASHASSLIVPRKTTEMNVNMQGKRTLISQGGILGNANCSSYFIHTTHQGSEAAAIPAQVVRTRN